MLPSAAERFLVGEMSEATHFMIDTYETTAEAAEEIPAVLHPADETTRPQVVTKDRNEPYYEVLQEIKSKTGVGVVLNTSFNDSGEPIVRTPREAVRDFYAMGMDTLVIGDFLLHK
jgi:carbamoyltransferase